MVQGLGFCAFTAEGLDLTFGQGTKIPQAGQLGQNHVKNEDPGLQDPIGALGWWEVAGWFSTQILPSSTLVTIFILTQFRAA